MEGVPNRKDRQTSWREFDAEDEMRGTTDLNDIVVVGNGVLALFLANELADRGQSAVTVVGPATRAGGASQAAAAMLGCFAEVTGETLASEAGRAKFEIGLEAHRRWPDVLSGLEDEFLTADQATSLRTATDTFVILNTVGGHLDTTNYEAMLSALCEYGVACDDVSPSDIAGYRPRPDKRAIRAVRLPDEGAVDARRLLHAAQLRAARRGIRFRDDSVTKVVLSTDGRVDGVQLASGESVVSRTVVVAAGAYSQTLLAPLAARHQIMPLFAGVGLSVVVDEVDNVRDAVLRTPNRAFACGLHSVPLPNGQIYLGATNAVASSPQSGPPLGDAQFLTTCAMEQIDDALAYGRVRDWRIGNRPVSLDGFPLLGWTSTPGLYLMSGTYRDGFHCAPVLAEHAADQILGNAGTLGSRWEPERRPLPVRTVEQSIEQMVEHRLASWFEADGHGPPQWSAGKLATVFRDQAQRFYDQLHIEYGLSADIVAFMMVSMRQKAAIDTVAYLRSRLGDG